VASFPNVSNVGLRFIIASVDLRIQTYTGTAVPLKYGKLATKYPRICEYVYSVQGALIKSNPLGKIHYLSYCNRFFLSKFTVFTEEDSRHICSKFRHNIYYGSEITTI